MAGDGQAVAVLAALSAEPGGATVAVIAARAGINTAAARQALLAHEKNGTATRVKGSRPRPRRHLDACRPRSLA